MRAWVNGRLLDDPHQPAVAVTDHGFTVGDGVFEAVKIVRGRPFALTRHLDRLVRSAEGLSLPPVDREAVRAGLAAVLAGRRGWGRGGTPRSRRRWWWWRRRWCPTRRRRAR